MIKIISIYLKSLGIIQLLGLNLGGIFWLFWASGIARKKSSSRYWVLSIHSIYLALFTFVLVKWLFQPDETTRLVLYGNHVEVGRMAVLAFLLVSFVIYGLPVIWLMRKDIQKQFIKQVAPDDRREAAPQPDP